MRVKEKSEKAGLKLNIQKTKVMTSCPITLWQIDGEKMEQLQILFSWAPKSLLTVTTAMKLKRHFLLGRKAMTNLDSVLKSRDSADKGPYSQSCGFSSSYGWMWESDHQEGWAPQNWCFGTVVLEKTLESPLDCKEIKPVNPKGDQSWIFTGRTDAEAEAPIPWPPGLKSWLTGKRFWWWERLKAKEEEGSRG